jgi:hypothetical protein
MALQRSCFSSRWPRRRAVKLPAGVHGWGHGGLLPITTMYGGLLKAEAWRDVAGPWRRWQRGEAEAHTSFWRGKDACARSSFWREGGAGSARSRPLALGEDTLLQPIVVCRFGVGERDTRVSWSSDGDTRAVRGEGALCKFHALQTE